MSELRSMTGFGAASVEADGRVVRVEVRSVNHRHLQVKARVPADLVALEPEIEARVRARMARGAVTLNLAVERASGLPPVALDHAAAERWKEALEALGARLGVPLGLDARTLLGLPGVLGADAAEDAAQGDDGARDLALRAVDDALDSLVEMRRREGAATARDLIVHADAIEALVASIGARMPEVVCAHHEALRGRIAELLGEDVPAADLAREAALIADRMDVGEELARLASHLDQLRGLVAAGGSVGRKLDFLAQEFFREANTTGAKCNDAAVAHLVVDLKTSIERLREQVQNVE